MLCQRTKKEAIYTTSKETYTYVEKDLSTRPKHDSTHMLCQRTKMEAIHTTSKATYIYLEKPFQRDRITTHHTCSANAQRRKPSTRLLPRKRCGPSPCTLRCCTSLSTSQSPQRLRFQSRTAGFRSGNILAEEAAARAPTCVDGVRVCVCMCVYIYKSWVYINIIYVHIYMYIYIYMYIWGMCVCVHIHNICTSYVCINVTNVYIYMYTYIHICIYLYIYYVYTYTY